MLRQAKKRFPWRFFWRVTLRQWFFSVFLLAVGVGVVRTIVFLEIPVEAVLSRGWLDRSFAYFFAVLTLGFFFLSMFSARHQVEPLMRLVRRARRIADREVVSALEQEQVLLENDESRELSELESALSRIETVMETGQSRIQKERAELTTILKSVNEPILALDRQHRVLFCNDRFSFLFGSKAQQQPITDFLRIPELLMAFEFCLKDGVEKRVSFQTYLQGSTLKREFELSVTPLKELEDAKRGTEVYGAVGVFYDITELKKAERLRIEFVGNVSHELRTPLTSIKGYTDTLVADLAQGIHEALPKYAQRITANVERLMNLVGDLLDLSALDAGVQLERKTVGLRALTEKVFAQSETLRSKKNITLTASYQIEELHVDPRRVEQVLTNLIDNALKYTQEGGSVKVHWGSDRSLRVEDNGPGILLEHQARLFERFYRVDKARSSSMGGTGLGLAIVKHIMIQHQGSVRVESRPGKGATFICNF